MPRASPTTAPVDSPLVTATHETCPSPEKPALHVHTNEPSLLVHVAFALQVPGSAHSSTSVQYVPLPV
jgi:hypothetical protein